MTNKKTFRAFLASLMALLLCVSSLLGTTYAWFTDSVTSANNIIQSGNLDIELEYWNGTEWKDVNGASDILTNKLWEPGVTEVAYLRVKNAGSLALKYQLGINIIDEIPGKNAEEEFFMLSDYIMFGVVEGVNGETGAYANREAAIAAVTDAKKISAGYSKADSLTSGKELYLALVVYMPTTVDNTANHNGVNIPEINLGINVLATQYGYEEDSFGNNYDADASVTVEPGESIANAIQTVEDGGIIFLENGVHNVASGPILITGKKVTIVGLGEVTINKNYGSTHIFTISNGADVTFENVNMDGKGNTREGLYVRWNSKVTLIDCSIKNTGGLDIMIDEASDAAHGEETYSVVNLINSHVEDVALCASPVTTVSATQDTFVYFNYDAKSTVGSIDKQSINLKPENIYINGVNSDENGKTMYLNVTNDAELAAALNTIKTDSKYWNKNVIVNMAAGEYSADHVINQYPEWNGVVGAGSTANNYASGVAGENRTIITFVGESASTYSLRAATVPTVVFTGNVTVNGFGNAGTGFATAVATTTFKNIAFDGANSADNAEDSIVMYVKAAANNVTFDGCTFVNATHVTLGGSGADGVGKVSFTGCTFNDGGCLSGYVETLDVSDSTVTAAKNGFINKAKAGTVTVDNCSINAGRYFIRTSNSGVELKVTNSDISVYESEGTKHLVYFRGTNESAEFTDCTIADGYTTAGVDADSTIGILNYSEVDGMTLITDGISKEVTLHEVPATYDETTVTVPAGVTAIGNYAFSNSNVKEVILPSTVRDLGRGFDSSSVEKVVLNEGLEVISSRAFRSTPALKEVVIPSTVTEIVDNAFQKSGIKEIVIPASVKTIGETAFGASLIEKVTFEGDIAIQGYAFRGCTKLRTVIMNGMNVTFVKSTLNGRNSMWFCNGESNNPNTSDIDFYVKNEVIKERVLTAMGAERNNTDVYCEEFADENGIFDDGEGNVYGYASDKVTLGDAISAGAKKVYLASGNYIIPAAAQGKTLTIVGSGDTTVAVTKVGTGGENCDYGFDGSNVTFENVTITTNSSTYIGYARLNATYNNCTFNGTYTLYGDSVFNNCTFNVSGDVYNIWTWGAPTATFNNCTFNNDGKAILLYGTANTKLTVNGCTFNDNGDDTVTGKAAIEIGNDYGKSYELIVNDTVVNGYAINSNGTPTGTTLWANKNSMGTDKLNVVVDGVEVY